VIASIVIRSLDVSYWYRCATLLWSVIGRDVVVDELSGVYVSVTRAARINKPVTLQSIPFFQRSSSITADSVHFLWLFGDEVS